MNAAATLAADVKSSLIETGSNSSPAPTTPHSTAQSATTVKTEPSANLTPAKPPSGMTECIVDGIGPPQSHRPGLMAGNEGDS